MGGVKQQMRTSLLAVTFCTTVVATTPSVAQSLCAPLSEFVRSVKPGETREFTFHTSWGGNFNDSHDEVMYAKRCLHNDYAPAKNVCVYLMESGAVEFAGNNVKEAVACLSPKTHFAPQLALHRASFSFNVGSDNRGANIKVDFYEDSELGGMAFRVAADGY